MIKDLTGLKFGQLIALEYSYTKDKDAYWLCQCDCGNKTIVNQARLRAGRTKSCGCLKLRFFRKSSSPKNQVFPSCVDGTPELRPCRKCIIKAYLQQSKVLERIYNIYDEVHEKFYSTETEDFFIKLEKKYPVIVDKMEEEDES